MKKNMSDSPKFEENLTPYETREDKLRLQFIEEGKTRIHFCMDWDGLLIHDEMPEFEACCCFDSDEPLPDVK